MNEYGKKLIEQARQKHNNLQKLYKPNKCSRRVWSMPEYTKVLMHTEGLSEADAQRLLRLLFSVIQKALLRGDVTVMPGVGKLYVQYMAPRGNDDHQVIPDAARVVFRASSNIKQLIKPNVKYYSRFNDQPSSSRQEKNQVESHPIDLEAFVVEQGWEDESGSSLED